MERYSSRKVDDQGRIILHSELRKKIELETGNKISLTVFDSIVIAKCTDSDGCEINELGMITIPAEIRQHFSWTTGSKVAVYNTDSLLILKSA